MSVQSGVREIVALIDQYKLNTRLFNNVIEEITEEKSNEKLSDNTNNVKWLVGHLLNARYGIANLIGVMEEDPNEDMFGHGKSIEEDIKYPSISSLRKQWNEFSPSMINKLESMTEDDLNKKAPFQLPIEDHTILGAISFFAHHEAYHIGQLGILRKYLDYGSMKYV
ncbi:MAG: DinB family protein [Chitinophagales bacterium]|nr:DinB family protein [Chitinophagales bacterium]